MKLTITRAVTTLITATASVVALSALPASAAPAVPSAAVGAANQSFAPGGDILAALRGFLGALGGSPSLAWSPTTSTGTYDFGTIDSAATQSQTFTLKNAGKGASGALKVALTGSNAFAINGSTCGAKPIAPRKTCTVTVRYAPTAPGASDTATLEASSKFPKANATLALEGHGAVVVQPVITYSSEFDLEAVFSRYCKVTLNITNVPSGTYRIVYYEAGREPSNRETFTSTGPDYVHTRTDGVVPDGTVWTVQLFNDATDQPVGPLSQPITVSC